MLSFIRPTRHCKIVPFVSHVSNYGQRRSVATFDGRCRASRLLQPLNLVPHEAGEAVSTKTPKKFEEISSKSSRLLVDLGFIRPASPGTFTYLNLALRSLEKLTSLADVVMEQAGCQKILLPTLVIVYICFCPLASQAIREVAKANFIMKNTNPLAVSKNCLSVCHLL